MADNEAPLELRIDGESYTLDDLTFAELREHRRLVRELSGDEDTPVAMADVIDFYPPLVYLIRKRSNPDYTLEQAQELKLSEVLLPVEKKNGRRPTRRTPDPEAAST